MLDVIVCTVMLVGVVPVAIGNRRWIGAATTWMSWLVPNLPESLRADEQGYTTAAMRIYATGFAFAAVDVPAQGILTGFGVESVGLVATLSFIGLVLSIIVLLAWTYARLFRSGRGLAHASAWSFLVVMMWFVVGFVSAFGATATNLGRS